MKDARILFRGAGDFASGSMRRLFLSGASVLAIEIERPLNVRRTASFAEAVWEKEWTVERVTAIKTSIDDVHSFDFSKSISIVTNASFEDIIVQFKPNVIIDARMKKRLVNDNNFGNGMPVIGLGPGFEVGVNCDLGVETLADKDLGRVYFEGQTKKDTGTPVHLNICSPCCCGVDDYAQLVLRAPGNGNFIGEKVIGDKISKGETIGYVLTKEGEKLELTAPDSGILRGIIHNGVEVGKDVKVGDIDPYCNKEDIFKISAKSNAIAGGVIEACWYLFRKEVLL